SDPTTSNEVCAQPDDSGQQRETAQACPAIWQRSTGRPCRTKPLPHVLAQRVVWALSPQGDSLDNAKGAQPCEPGNRVSAHGPAPPFSCFPPWIRTTASRTRAVRHAN